MTIRELIQKLEIEKLKLSKENEQLKSALKKITSEKTKIETELLSLKKLLEELNNQDTLVMNLNVETEEPQVTEVTIINELGADHTVYVDEIPSIDDAINKQKTKKNRRKKKVEKTIEDVIEDFPIEETPVEENPEEIC